MPNKNLTQAKKAKSDEFYTQLTDIEKELSHYIKHFKGKVVLCNCDDPFESNFFRYFVLNFNRLGLKKLITTSYAGSPIAYRQLNMFDYVDGVAPDGRKRAYKAEITVVHGKTATSGYNMDDIANLFVAGENKLELLEGDGDFRSQECLNILDEADIVVSNPPFSLWREYVSVLIKHNVKFIIIGNQNAITYKEIFPLLKENEMWLGYGFSGNVGYFASPYQDYAASSQHKNGLIRVSGVMWFTNLDIKKRHEELILVKQYHGHEDEYPHYDNYDAINVDKTVDIPCDYDGVMGVPITFLDKYNPEQFEIVNANDYRVNPNTPTKPHGLIKDKEAKITLDKSSRATTILTDRQTDSQTDRHEPSMHESASNGSSEPYVLTGGHTCINGKRKYARVLIKRALVARS